MQIPALQCSSALGSTNAVYSKSRFTNSSVVIDDSVSVIIDDCHISSHSNPLQISQDSISERGSRTFYIDTVLDEGVDLVFPEFCRIDCHQIVGGNMSLIRQLVVDCNSSHNGGQPISIRNNTEFESFEYWSAYRVILNNDSVSSVYPGGLLPISYSIVDRDGHIIDHYSSNISIHLINTELGVLTNLLIQENGRCPQCEIGVYVEGITIHDVNTTYTINVLVDDNVLLSNDIEIMVDRCPSGYGVFGWGQCAVCEERTYSIGKTDGRCIDCPEDELDDVIKVK